MPSFIWIILALVVPFVGAFISKAFKIRYEDYENEYIEFLCEKYDYTCNAGNYVFDPNGMEVSKDNIWQEMDFYENKEVQKEFKEYLKELR